jgi:hypothetical protein
VCQLDFPGKAGRRRDLDTGCRERPVRLAGLEPATTGLEGRCSIQLSYRRETCHDNLDGCTLLMPPGSVPGDQPRPCAPLRRPTIEDPPHPQINVSSGGGPYTGVVLSAGGACPLYILLALTLLAAGMSGCGGDFEPSEPVSTRQPAHGRWGEQFGQRQDRDHGHRGARASLPTFHRQATHEMDGPSPRLPPGSPVTPARLRSRRGNDGTRRPVGACLRRHPSGCR